MYQELLSRYCWLDVDSDRISLMAVNNARRKAKRGEVAFALTSFFIAYGKRRWPFAALVNFRYKNEFKLTPFVS